MKVIAVIPCYNEAPTIGDIVSRAKPYTCGVIVVDNDSEDSTADAAIKAGAKVVFCGAKGAGVATQLGFQCDITPQSWADVVVTLDGDGQHNPDEIPIVVAPILQGEADLVIGSRFLAQNNIPRYRKLGIKVITLLLCIGSKYKIGDAVCCFRAYSRTLLDCLNVEETGFGFSVETLIKARAMGFRIKEVPIGCVYHGIKLDSTFNPIKLGLILAWAVVKWRVIVAFRKMSGQLMSDMGANGRQARMRAISFAQDKNEENRR